MAASGTSMSITVPGAVMDEFKQMKQRRKYRWMMFSINQDTFELQLAASGLPSDSAKDFIRKLPPSEARYACFDHTFQNKYGGTQNRIYVFMWTPANAGKQNLFLAAQRSALDNFFSGCDSKQATKASDIEAVLIPKAVDAEEADWDPDA